jgi:hypothetical protein
MKKIDRETAIAELDSWFEKKKIFQSQRDSQKDSVNTLIDAIQEGVLTLNKDTNVLTHTLLLPEDGEKSIKTLTYRPRLNDVILKPFMEGNKSGSVIDMMLSYCAALTDTTKGVLARLDSADKRIANSIAVFFM